MIYKVVNKILLTTTCTKHKRHELNMMGSWRELLSMNSRGEPHWEPTSTILCNQPLAALKSDKHSRYLVELSAVHFREPARVGIRNNNFI